MKINGYVRVHRSDIESEKELNDAETRLYRLYYFMADWDKRHKETFGTVNIPFHAMKAAYLPPKGWSIGKISETINSLIEKNRLRRVSKTRIAVDKFTPFHNQVQNTEQNLQPAEHNVQPVEPNVHSAEHRTPEQNLQLIQEMKRNIGKEFR